MIDEDCAPMTDRDLVAFEPPERSWSACPAFLRATRQNANSPSGLLFRRLRTCRCVDFDCNVSKGGNPDDISESVTIPPVVLIWKAMPLRAGNYSSSKRVAPRARMAIAWTT
jgi:hypothetical protein